MSDADIWVHTKEAKVNGHHTVNAFNSFYHNTVCTTAPVYTQFKTKIYYKEQIYKKPYKHAAFVLPIPIASLLCMLATLN